MKKCPYCAEEIQDEAIKCKHCKEFLDNEVRIQSRPSCNDCGGKLSSDGQFCLECGVLQTSSDEKFVSLKKDLNIMHSNTGDSGKYSKITVSKFSEDIASLKYPIIATIIIVPMILFINYINPNIFNSLNTSLNKNSNNSISAEKIISLIQAQDILELNIIAKNGVDLDVKNQNNWTPLTAAIWVGCSECVEIIIESGADLNLSGINDLTPVAIATFKNDLIILKKLINKGADIDKANSLGVTPLMIAAGQKNADAMVILINAGANLNLKDKDGMTSNDYAEQALKYK